MATEPKPLSKDDLHILNQACVTQKNVYERQITSAKQKDDLELAATWRQKLDRLEAVMVRMKS